MSTSDMGLNPFPGLRPFASDEDHLFFGREEQTDALVRRLRQHRFLAVVGASGSGKSSLVRAGLMPALHGGLMTKAGSHWRIALMRPGGTPMASLAKVLTKPEVFGDEQDDDAARQIRRMMTQTTLRRSSLGLVDVVEQVRMPAGVNFLLVVDQFEELFRFTDLGDANEDAPAFVKLLLEAALTDRVPIYIVLTMRSDFIGDCSQFRDLPEMLNDAQFLVPRLTRDQQQQAIMGPVAVGGASMQGRLLQRLLNDVGNSPDQLPVMQHALMRTWQCWHQEGSASAPIDMPHYEATGGMAHALSQHADEAFHALPDPVHWGIAEHLFKRLTFQDADARGIRRPTQLSALYAVCNAPEEDVNAVVEAFSRPDRSFLMPPADVPLTPGTIIDISHESLMRVWGRLEDWVREEAESAYMYRRLAEAARLHAAGKTGLWNDPELQLALDWRDAQQPTLAWTESYGYDFETTMAFLDASEARRDAELQRWQAQRRKALEQAQALANEQRQRAEEQRQRAEEQTANARRLRRRLFITLILAALAVAAAAFALYSRGVAHRESRLADSRRLAAEVLDRLDTQLDLALLLGVEAFRTSDTPAAQNALQAALEHSPHLDGYLNGHRGTVFQVAYSPDGKRLASASGDSTVRLWDLATRRTIGAPLRGHRDAVTAVAFSPDGNTLASASWDQTILLWDANTGTLLDSLTGHADGVTSLAFSPDGNTLASASRDRTAKLWDVASRQLRLTLEGHSDAVTSAVFSPDVTTLATGSYDSTIRRWRVADGAAAAPPLTLPSTLVYTIAYDPDGTMLAAGSDDGLVRLWDTASDTLRATLSGHANAVYSVAFSPDTSLVASASWDNSVLLWDAATGEQRGEALVGHEEYVASVAFSPDSQSLASGSYDNTIILWKVHTGQPRGEDLLAPTVAQQSAVQSIAFNPTGSMLASGNGANTIQLWDVATQRMLTPLLEGHRSIVNGVAFHPEGAILASAGLDNTVRIWDVATRRSLHTLTDHHAPVLTVAYSPDGRLLASAGWEGTILLWDATTYEEIAELYGHSDAIWSLAFSPDGTELASGSRDKTIRVWNVKEQTTQQTLQAHLAVVYSVAFSPDGSLLASGSGDNSIFLWDTATWTPNLHLMGHKAYVQSVAFHPEGTVLASGSWDHTVRLWDVATGEHIWQLTGHESVVNTVVFSPRADLLASGSWDHRIMLWPLPTQSLLRLPDATPAQRWQRRIETACLIANRNLTHDEWTLTFGDQEPYRATCPDAPVPPAM